MFTAFRSKILCRPMMMEVYDSGNRVINHYVYGIILSGAAGFSGGLLGGSVKALREKNFQGATDGLFVTGVSGISCAVIFGGLGCMFGIAAPLLVPCLAYDVSIAQYTKYQSKKRFEL